VGDDGISLQRHRFYPARAATAGHPVARHGRFGGHQRRRLVDAGVLSGRGHAVADDHPLFGSGRCSDSCASMPDGKSAKISPRT
jgi:hypothetical protein